MRYVEWITYHFTAKMQEVVKVVNVFHYLSHLQFTVNLKALSISIWIEFMFLLYTECVGLLSLLCACVCGNYCDLNAGSAGETGCLLINEWSRWPWVGGSCKRTASQSGGQHNADTWAITNRTSQMVDIRPVCVYVYMCLLCVFMAFPLVNKKIYFICTMWYHLSPWKGTGGLYTYAVHVLFVNWWKKNKVQIYSTVQILSFRHV